MSQICETYNNWLYYPHNFVPAIGFSDGFLPPIFQEQRVHMGILNHLKTSSYISVGILNW